MFSADSFLEKLEQELNIDSIERITFQIIIAFYKKFCNFFKCCSRLQNKHVKLLAKCSLMYIDCIQSYVDNAPQLGIKQIEAIKQFIQILGDIPKLENVKDGYMRWIVFPLLAKVVEPNRKSWCSKEILKNFNRAIQCTRKDLRCGLAEKHLAQLCKLADVLSTCGDYDYQITLMETIFRMCSEKQINDYANVFFPESEILENGIRNINKNNFDKDVRGFLNHVNAKFKNVLSVKCEYAALENSIVSAPKDSYGNRLPLWIDFNLGAKTITILCDKDSLKTSSDTDDSESGEWETITINFSNITHILMSMLLAEDSPVSQGSIIIFSLIPPCTVLHPSSRDAVQADILKLAIFKCPELEELKEEALPKIFGDKFINISVSSQEEESVSIASQQSVQGPNVLGVTQKMVYKPLRVSISRTKAGMGGASSSVSDAMSLKSRLREVEQDVFEIKHTNSVCQSPKIRNIEELRKSAAKYGSLQRNNDTVPEIVEINLISPIKDNNSSNTNCEESEAVMSELLLQSALNNEVEQDINQRFVIGKSRKIMKDETKQKNQNEIQDTINSPEIVEINLISPIKDNNSSNTNCEESEAVMSELLLQSALNNEVEQDINQRFVIGKSRKIMKDETKQKNQNEIQDNINSPEIEDKSNDTLLENTEVADISLISPRKDDIGIETELTECENENYQTQFVGKQIANQKFFSGKIYAELKENDYILDGETKPETSVHIPVPQENIQVPQFENDSFSKNEKCDGNQPLQLENAINHQTETDLHHNAENQVPVNVIETESRTNNEMQENEGSYKRKSAKEVIKVKWFVPKFSVSQETRKPQIIVDKEGARKQKKLLKSLVKGLKISKKSRNGRRKTKPQTEQEDLKDSLQLKDSEALPLQSKSPENNEILNDVENTPAQKKSFKSSGPNITGLKDTNDILECPISSEVKEGDILGGITPRRTRLQNRVLKEILFEQNIPISNTEIPKDQLTKQNESLEIQVNEDHTEKMTENTIAQKSPEIQDMQEEQNDKKHVKKISMRTKFSKLQTKKLKVLPKTPKPIKLPKTKKKSRKNIKNEFTEIQFSEEQPCSEIKPPECSASTDANKIVSNSSTAADKNDTLLNNDKEHVDDEENFEENRELLEVPTSNSMPLLSTNMLNSEEVAKKNMLDAQNEISKLLEQHNEEVSCHNPLSIHTELLDLSVNLPKSLNGSFQSECAEISTNNDTNREVVLNTSIKQPLSFKTPAIVENEAHSSEQAIGNICDNEIVQIHEVNSQSAKIVEDIQLKDVFELENVMDDFFTDNLDSNENDMIYNIKTGSETTINKIEKHRLDDFNENQSAIDINNHEDQSPVREASFSEQVMCTAEERNKNSTLELGQTDDVACNNDINENQPKLTAEIIKELSDVETREKDIQIESPKCNNASGADKQILQSNSEFKQTILNTTNTEKLDCAANNLTADSPILTPIKIRSSGKRKRLENDEPLSKHRKLHTEISMVAGDEPPKTKTPKRRTSRKLYNPKASYMVCDNNITLTDIGSEIMKAENAASEITEKGANIEPELTVNYDTKQLLVPEQAIGKNKAIEEVSVNHDVIKTGGSSIDDINVLKEDLFKETVTIPPQSPRKEASEQQVRHSENATEKRQTVEKYASLVVERNNSIVDVTTTKPIPDEDHKSKQTGKKTRLFKMPKETISTISKKRAKINTPNESGDTFVRNKKQRKTLPLYHKKENDISLSTNQTLFNRSWQCVDQSVNSNASSKFDLCLAAVLTSMKQIESLSTPDTKRKSKPRKNQTSKYEKLSSDFYKSETKVNGKQKPKSKAFENKSRKSVKPITEQKQAPKTILRSFISSPLPDLCVNNEVGKTTEIILTDSVQREDHCLATVKKDRIQRKHKNAKLSDDKENGLNPLLTPQKLRCVPSLPMESAVPRRQDDEDYYPVSPYETSDKLVLDWIKSGNNNPAVKGLKCVTDLVLHQHHEMYKVLLKVLPPFKDNTEQDFSSTIHIAKQFNKELKTYFKKK